MTSIDAHKEPMWMMRDGSLVAIRTLRDGHLLNIQRMLEANEQHNPDVDDEIERRRLAPLPPADPIEQQCRNAINGLRSLWPQLSEGQQQGVRRSLASLLRAIGAAESADYLESEVRR